MFSSKHTLIFILIAATCIAYLSSLGNPFIWDDEQFITKNNIVQQFDIVKIFTTSTTAGAGVQSNYYRPLTTLSFAIDTKIWGQNPFGFHVTNLMLHIGAGVLVFLLLSELGLPQLVSFFIALFFLINPLQVEAVSYINSRGDSMYAFFLFLSLYMFAKLGRVGRLSWLGVLGVVGTFLCSLLSKEIAMAGVGLYALIWGLGAIKGIREKRMLWIVAAVVVVTAIYFFLRLGPLNFGNTLNFYGAQTEYTRSLAIRLFTFCKVLWVYLGLLVWPYPLHMERTVELVRSFFSPWVVGVMGVMGILGALGVREVRRGNAWILFGLLWFLIMLVPGSGIIPINGILYEHWLYVPMIGFFLVIYGLLKIINKYTNKQIDKLLILFAILLAILYISLTIRQNNIWSDPIQFYSYTLSFAPNSARIHNNLGISYANEGEVNKAIPEYKKALQLGQEYPQIYNNLGNAQIAVGDYIDAEKNLEKALQLSPGFEVAKLNLIKLYIVEHQWGKAEKEAAGNNEVLSEIKQLHNNK